MDPVKQWKPGYSAYELAHSWENAGHFPEKVETVFENSGIPLFSGMEFLYGFPEYQVSLPGGGASSQTDLYVLAKAGTELVVIMVEGKVSEPFGETVEKWLGDSPSDGKRKRLDWLTSLLALKEEEITGVRYQLLHRTTAAIIEAKRVNAGHALMLVHSFSKEGKGFEDYRDFVRLFNLNAGKDSISGPVDVQGVQLYFSWVSEMESS